MKVVRLLPRDQCVTYGCGNYPLNHSDLHLTSVLCVRVPRVRGVRGRGVEARHRHGHEAGPGLQCQDGPFRTGNLSHCCTLGVLFTQIIAHFWTFKKGRKISKIVVLILSDGANFYQLCILTLGPFNNYVTPA